MAEAPSRNFHANQEQVLVDVLCKLKPIGGEFDGKMGPRVALIWQPILELFIKDVAPGLVQLAEGNKGFKLDFDLGMIHHKWVALKKRFKQVEIKHDVRSYIDIHQAYLQCSGKLPQFLLGSSFLLFRSARTSPPWWYRPAAVLLF